MVLFCVSAFAFGITLESDDDIAVVVMPKASIASKDTSIIVNDLVFAIFSSYSPMFSKMWLFFPSVRSHLKGKN